MAEWRAGWWARTFSGAGRWLLVIDDGQLRVHCESQRIETGVLDVVEIRAEPGTKLLTIRIANQPSVTLTGAARRVARQATSVLSDQVADQRRLTDLTERAVAQGDEARRWWSEAHRTMTRRRWIDRETVASIDRDRPDVSASVAAYSDPRLAEFIAGRPEDERAAIDACRTVDLNAWAARQNESFIEWEKSESGGFFRTVEKSPLTDEQILATICFDNRVRAIASAGSGKTSTMVARAGYAVRRGIAEPGEILMLAFNKKAAAELSERAASRLGDQGTAIASTTFHAFGLRVIGEATDRKPGLPDDLASDNGIGRLSRIVDALRDQNPGFRRDWDLFRLVFGRHLPELGDEPPPEAADRRSGSQGFETLAGEVMKSQEEVMIANWLFFNGVEYQYERPYEHDVADAGHRQYHPDFFYPAIDVYHEHWALGPDGNPPPQFAGYADSMNWRRQTHARFGTRLIETTSAKIRDGSGFVHLAGELGRLGVELDENPDRKAVGEPPINDRALVQLMRTFMVHVKGNRLAPDELASRAGTAQLRSRLFLRLFKVVSGAWDRDLRAHNQIDFEDMLSLATDHIESGRWVSPYRVVMVDEMQDASSARAALVRALLKRPGTYLYAVGDDWQSVNRFAGADLGVLTRFSEWFGDAETVWLSRTFRSPQSLCDVAGSFVMENPVQLKKRVRSNAPEPGESLIAIGLKDHSEYDDTAWEYCALLDKELDSPATVLILSRYQRGRDDVPSVLSATFTRLTVEFSTVHASKGKEADYVVLLGLESGGFPSAVEDDPLLQLAMAAPDSFPHEEERRLFYVALTRARRSVLLLTRTGHESPFLIELIRANAVQVRSPAGTNITPVICPQCKKRIMRRRRGKRGPFLGCDGYPLCTGTMDIPQQRSLSHA
jgi:DNA helicase-4